MILAILLSTFSFQIVSVTLSCPNSLRTLAASTDIEMTIFETYAELLKNIPLDELHQLQKNPLQVPRSKKLEDFSGHQSIFKSLISLIQTNFSPNQIQNQLLPKLKILIDSEIREKTLNEKKQVLEKSRSKSIRKDFIIPSSDSLGFILSPDGSIIYSTGRTPQFWNAKTGEPLRDSQNNPLTLKRHSDWISTFALSPNSEILYSSSYDHTIQLWNAKTGEPIRNSENNPIILEGHSEQVKALAVSPDGKILYSGSHDQSIRFWNAKTGEPLRDSQNNIIIMRCDSDELSAWISALTLSPDGEILYSGSIDGTIRFWNAKTGKPLPRFRFFKFLKIPIILEDHLNSIRSLTVSPNGEILYSMSADTTIRLWNAKTGKPLLTSKNNPIILRSEASSLRSLALSSDGKILYIGSSDNTIRLWNTKTNQPIRDSRNNLIIINGHSTSNELIALNPNGEILYSGSDDGKIIAWYLPDYLPREYFEAAP